LIWCAVTTFRELLCFNIVAWVTFRVSGPRNSLFLKFYSGTNGNKLTHIYIKMVVWVILGFCSVCYSVYWRYAPETVESSVFTRATDCWMYAVVLWELFSLGADPWPFESPEEVRLSYVPQLEQV